MRLFKSKLIHEQLTNDELKALENDFKAYKSPRANSTLPDTFGRDELYDHPNNLPIIKAEEVRHIHLCDRQNMWHPKTLQFKKTSDSHLVYCRGSQDLDCCLLMIILSPQAHKKARDNQWMYSLGLIAERFRQQY